MCYVGFYVVTLMVRTCLRLDFGNAAFFALSGTPMLFAIFISPLTLSGVIALFVFSNQATTWDRWVRSPFSLFLEFAVGCPIGGIIAFCFLAGLIHSVNFLHYWARSLEGTSDGALREFANATAGPLALVGALICMALSALHYAVRGSARHSIKTMERRMPVLVEKFQERRS
jgi:hypothetical protein